MPATGCHYTGRASGTRRIGKSEADVLGKRMVLDRADSRQHLSETASLLHFLDKELRLVAQQREPQWADVL